MDKIAELNKFQISNLEDSIEKKKKIENYNKFQSNLDGIICILAKIIEKMIFNYHVSINLLKKILRNNNNR